MLWIVLVVAAVATVGAWRICKGVVAAGSAAPPAAASAVIGALVMISWAIATWLFWIVAALVALCVLGAFLEKRQGAAKRPLPIGRHEAGRTAFQIGHGTSVDDEDAHFDDVSPLRQPERVWFAYETSSGKVSNREVTVFEVGPAYFRGYCHLRRGERTFRYDRIIGDVVRTDTGEVLAAREWRAGLVGDELAV